MDRYSNRGLLRYELEASNHNRPHRSSRTRTSRLHGLDASEGLFTTPLYSAESDATHAISSGYIADEFADLLPCGDQQGNIEALLATLKSVEFPITLEELTQLLSMIDISEEEPYAAMERLGLSLASNEFLPDAG